MKTITLLSTAVVVAMSATAQPRHINHRALHDKRADNVVTEVVWTTTTVYVTVRASEGHAPPSLAELSPAPTPEVHVAENPAAEVPAQEAPAPVPASEVHVPENPAAEVPAQEAPAPVPASEVHVPENPAAAVPAQEAPAPVPASEVHVPENPAAAVPAQEAPAPVPAPEVHVPENPAAEVPAQEAPAPVPASEGPELVVPNQAAYVKPAASPAEAPPVTPSPYAAPLEDTPVDTPPSIPAVTPKAVEAVAPEASPYTEPETSSGGDGGNLYGLVMPPDTAGKTPDCTGTTCTGSATWYGPINDQMCCGYSGMLGQDDSRRIVALPIAMMSGSSNANAPGLSDQPRQPNCGRMVEISLADGSKSTTAQVVDACGGCKVNSLDMSYATWDSLGLDRGLGVADITWKFMN